MDSESLEIIPVNDDYLVKDKNTKIMFDKNGNATSLPMHYVYGGETTKLLGKYTSILAYISFAVAILFVVIFGFLNK